MAKKGEVAFLIISVETGEVEAVALSVTAAYDINQQFSHAGKTTYVKNMTVNAYRDPTTNEVTRYVDPDTLRRQAKKS